MRQSAKPFTSEPRSTAFQRRPNPSGPARSRPSPRGSWFSCSLGTTTARRTPAGRSLPGAVSRWARSHYHFVLPLIHFIPYLPRDSVPLLFSEATMRPNPRPLRHRPALLLLRARADGRGALRALPAPLLQGDAPAGPGVVRPPADVAVRGPDAGRQHGPRRRRPHARDVHQHAGAPATFSSTTQTARYTT
jgi:hypothetical protein